MPVVSRPAPGAPKVEQLTRMYPKHLPTSAVIGNSQTRYLHQHFDPYDRAAPAFITIRGASTFDIEKELANLPRSVTTLVFHVGTTELERYGTDETLRRCCRLVNNTLRGRPELHRLIVSLVLPRHTNRRLDQSNHRFVHWFNTEARKFNNTVKGYCRKPGKVTFLDHDFTSLPPLRVLAADGLHPSFTGVALLAANLKSILQRGASTTSPGWSSEIPTAATANCTRRAASEEPRRPESPRRLRARETQPHPLPSRLQGVVIPDEYAVNKDEAPFLLHDSETRGELVAALKKKHVAIPMILDSRFELRSAKQRVVNLEQELQIERTLPRSSCWHYWWTKSRLAVLGQLLQLAQRQFLQLVLLLQFTLRELPAADAAVPAAVLVAGPPEAPPECVPVLAEVDDEAIVSVNRIKKFKPATVGDFDPDVPKSVYWEAVGACAGECQKRLHPATATAPATRPRSAPTILCARAAELKTQPRPALRRNLRADSTPFCQGCKKKGHLWTNRQCPTGQGINKKMREEVYSYREQRMLQEQQQLLQQRQHQKQPQQQQAEAEVRANRVPISPSGSLWINKAKQGTMPSPPSNLTAKIQELRSKFNFPKAELDNVHATLKAQQEENKKH
ncbi:uncharacterized protein ISCGN_026739 [Ixodes scapularis]